MRLLSFEQLRAAAKRAPRIKEVPCEELGGAVLVRRATPAEWVDSTPFLAEGAEREARQQAIRDLVAACICDESGESILTPEQFAELDLAFGTVIGLFDEVCKISGVKLSKDDRSPMEDKAGNLEDPPTPG